MFLLPLTTCHLNDYTIFCEIICVRKLLGHKENSILISIMILEKVSL